MEKIILTNNTEFEICEGASLGNIQIEAESFEAIKTITDAFVNDNLVEVAFKHNGEISGKYTDLKLDGFTYMQNIGEDGKEDGTYIVTIRLQMKTEIEKVIKVIDELKAGHESNAGAIQDLADMLAGGGE